MASAKAWWSGLTTIFVFLLAPTAMSSTVFVYLMVHGSGPWAVFYMVVTGPIAVAGISATLFLALVWPGIRHWHDSE
jgi:hypothetical protein